MHNTVDTPARLEKARQALAKAERHYSLENERLRKQDVHRKIKLGSLIIKAGLDNYSPSALLGLLNEASERLQQQPQVLEDWQHRGDDLLYPSS